MDLDKKQIEWGQDLVRQFLAKDRKNLRYLNLAVGIIGFFTYLWAIDDVGDSYIIAPFIFIIFGSVIVYFTWYWKKGPGGTYLDSLDMMKSSGIGNPKTGKYWMDLDKKLSAALLDNRWDEALSLSDNILSQRRELELSTVSMLLSSAESARPLCLFKLGRYQEAKTSYESKIGERMAKGLFVSDADRDILGQCIAKLSVGYPSGVYSNSPHSPMPSQQIPNTTSIQQSSPISPPPILMKNCHLCQTPNPTSNKQCKLCLSHI